MNLNVNQDQLRQKIFDIITEVTPGKKMASASKIAKEAGISYLTFVKFLEGGSIRSISLLRLATWFEKKEGTSNEI